ncbi:MAG: hypothetical protein HY319_00120 [Armatimonadetes bacterium]|nr:hypothetical protein [Armatimonadota bacterium]
MTRYTLPRRSSPESGGGASQTRSTVSVAGAWSNPPGTVTRTPSGVVTVWSAPEGERSIEKI